ncbi:MAG TPA: hypothetical protein VGF94_13490 [Kofleriaceae bacterium]|jgi:hypothetical protein
MIAERARVPWALALALATSLAPHSSPVPVPVPVPVPAPVPVPDLVPSLTPAERELAQVWRARHPGEPQPTCQLPDPIATLYADLDPAPGVERVIGDQRFGIAMYDARGRLLGTADVGGCSDWSVSDHDSLVLSTSRVLGTRYPQLVARTRVVDNCNDFAEMSILDHRAGKLVDIADIDLDGKAGCGPVHGYRSWRTHVTVPRPGVIDVREDGRESADAATWSPFHFEETLRAGPDGKFR